MNICKFPLQKSRSRNRWGKPAGPCSNPAGFCSNILGFRAELQIALVCAAQKKTKAPNHRVKQFTTNGQQLTVPNRQMYVYTYITYVSFIKLGYPQNIHL